jgi:hypothetical protein
MSTLYARPTEDWPVLGLQEQSLGTVVCCALDAATGEVKFLQLRTAWQTIDIEWHNLVFDENRQTFKLHRPAAKP